MEVSPTNLNVRLAELLERRMSADQSKIAGKAGFWKALGVGLILLGVGFATGLCFFGYSFIARNTSNAEVLSSAFTKALSGIELRGKTDGTVQLQPQEIKLASGQTISLDADSRVRLDPSAKVTADGEIKIQTPTISVPPGSVTRSVNQPVSISNFTVFKSVPFQKGNVFTGWIFLTSAQMSPTRQYCYYNEQSDSSDLSVRVNIAADETVEANIDAPTTFDISEAFTKCVWFKR